MAHMVIANIRVVFFRIIGETVSSTYDDLINRAIRKLELFIGDREIDQYQASCCEYAAAAQAAYEHAYEYASAERLAMSETGAVHRAQTGSSCIEAAKQLRDHAFAQLAGIGEDPDFIFRTMGDDSP